MCGYYCAGGERDRREVYLIACVLSKRKSQSVAFNLKNPDGFQGEISSKTATPGQIISLDPVGPISPKSIGGYSLMWSVYA